MKWRRPSDYFAEMVKSDEHMKRVKDKLLYEKKLSDGQEERRKHKEAKKYGKFRLTLVGFLQLLLELNTISSPPQLNKSKRRS